MSAVWKPIDDTARNGDLWPVISDGGPWGLALYSNGKWRYLVKLMAGYGLLAPEPPADPEFYFDIPDGPVKVVG